MVPTWHAYMGQRMAKQENFSADRICGFRCHPGKTQTIYWDGKTPGLGFRITANGAKAYIFETRLDGKTIRMTIGDPETWPLETQWRTDPTTGEKYEFRLGARQKANQLKNMVDQRIDPREVDRASKEAKEQKAKAVESAKKFTLGSLHEAYCKHLDSKEKLKSARTARSLFKTHVGASLEKTPAKNVTSEQIADLLRSVREKGKERTAGAIRTNLLAAYNVAMQAGLDSALPVAFKDYGITINPVAITKAIAGKAGNRVITNDHLKTYLKALDDRASDKALALALLSGGQRMEQVMRITTADWSPETKVLRLFDPKGRRKEPRIHLLPLAPRAAAIVNSLIPDDGEDRKLFAMDDLAPGKRVRTICADTKITPAFNLRDIRRTVETRLAELGISKDMRGQIMSHGIGGVQEKHYDRHHYTKEKRAVLVAWENWLTQLEKTKKKTNVVQMRQSNGV